ncbi:BON domain-containing protein [Phenylobacterium sp.]|uniref:BON domain-containing protein n=1 Tax=Phenylobacterium sp. TaxID=1871053 RepID=UPI0025D22525|nr:BON domain-containing protein [Phenylobacterium sp.]MBX3483518.1 BON domain-containing protein [Phenylobacterium sp.]
MAREDWRDLEADRLRRLRDRDDDDRGRDRDDYGQADYSSLYGYDPVNRTGYRAYDDGRPHDEARRFDDEGRPYYDDRARRDAWDDEHRRARRDGPSDRVLWAVIMERLDRDRRVDMRDVRIEVHDREVFLDGTVRRKDDKRRIEDIADIDGVRNVQNNLRLREHRRWLFL